VVAAELEGKDHQTKGKTDERRGASSNHSVLFHPLMLGKPYTPTRSARTAHRTPRGRYGLAQLGAGFLFFFFSPFLFLFFLFLFSVFFFCFFCVTFNFKILKI
jgi:hypothetical protein